MGLLWFGVWFGLIAFLVGFLLTVFFGASVSGASVVAGIGVLVVGVGCIVIVALSPTEPVHESVQAFGRHVSPYLWLFAGLNLLGWWTGVAAGWTFRRTAMRSRDGHQAGHPGPSIEA